jgi:hypothetical protein
MIIQQKGLAEMDSYREIENIYSDYAYFMDTGNMEAFARLFTHGRVEDGGNVIVGYEELKKSSQVVTLYSDGTPRTNHCMTNINIVVDEAAGTAKGRAYGVVFQQVPEDNFPLQPLCTVIYQDSFKRIGDKWWFDVRRVTQPMISDYSRHVKGWSR